MVDTQGLSLNTTTGDSREMSTVPRAQIPGVFEKNPVPNRKGGSTCLLNPVTLQDGDIMSTTRFMESPGV